MKQIFAIHGFTGDKTSFDLLKPHFEKSINMKSISLPGHGESADSRLGFSQTVELILSHLTPETIVYGYSMGARLALACAVNTNIRALILESGTPGIRDEKVRAQRNKDDLDLAASIVEAGVEKFVDFWEKKEIFLGLRSAPEEVRERVRTIRTSHTAKGLSHSLLHFGQGVTPNLWARLSEMRMPLLVVNGERDSKYVAIGRSMVEAWGGTSRREIIKGTYHVPHIEAPRETARALLKFVNDF